MIYNSGWVKRIFKALLPKQIQRVSLNIMLGNSVGLPFFLIIYLHTSVLYGEVVKDSLPDHSNIIDKTFNLADDILDRLNGKRWSFMPVFTYSPETKLGLGGRAICIFKDTDSDQSEIRPSMLSATLLYTLRNQTLLTSEFNNWRKNNKRHLFSRLELVDFPFIFYGVGNDVGKDDEEFYTSRYLNYVFAYKWRIGKLVYIGPQYHFRLEDVYKVEDEKLLFKDTFRGSQGQRLSGIGFLISYDTRNNIFQPSQGALVDISLLAYDQVLGSEYNLYRYRFDFRKYKRIISKHVLAAQAVFNFTYGDPTFQSLAFLGGSEIMRGVFEGRYRDNHSMAYQLEYRLPVYRKLGVVLFGSAGQVAPKLSVFSADRFHYSGGMGVRYTFGNSGLNIRLDIAYGDRRAMYFGLNEAF